MFNRSAIFKECLFSSLLIAAFLIALLAVELTPSTAGPVTIVTRPFANQSAMDVLTAAHGQLLSAGCWPWIAVAADSDDPAFLEKLRMAGTLFLLPPLANTCVKGQALKGK